jgi:DNA polymerase-3 subunit alpha (Gram-positive type)
MIRRLEDLTGIKATEIPLDDKKVMSLFKGTEVLGITPDDINGIPLGSLGIPEFGTEFAMQMLIDADPKSFSDLVRIAGLSHGTDVWLGNAQKLIQEGTCELSSAICCRDDIMVYLLNQGLDSGDAFTIMERVRKGLVAKGKCNEWPDFKKTMEEHGVPDWYIWSCEQIKYMFPKAHAVAYVLSAMRIAWFKVHKPELFYSAFLSIRADKFDLKTIVKGKSAIDARISEIDSNKNSTDVEQAQADVLRVVSECFGRGILIEKPNLNKSDYKTFIINKNYGSLIAPFSAIDGLGEAVAKSITDERETNGLFKSVEDFKERIKSKKINEAVDEFEMEI